VPYTTTKDLPYNVRHTLPIHGQVIYKKAFNNAYLEYADPDDRRDSSSREAVAHKVAWSAVKRKYHTDYDGEWRANS
jgi:cation transport regulator